jgi:hypothetical protein
MIVVSRFPPRANAARNTGTSDRQTPMRRASTSGRPRNQWTAASPSAAIVSMFTVGCAPNGTNVVDGSRGNPAEPTPFDCELIVDSNRRRLISTGDLTW